jgi:hypothetical protein
LDESDARLALRGLGITPTAGLIRSWLQAARAEELEEVRLQAFSRPPRSPQAVPPSAVANSRPRHPRGYSKSQLEPMLLAQGTLERQPGKRKPGRPRIVASWFEPLAAAMADGTSLRVALQRIGITLDKSQIRALYRNREFQRLYQEIRHSH